MRVHGLTAGALALCMCIAVVQYSSVGRVFLENKAPKGPSAVPFINTHGFGTDSAFIGKGDGQGTSVKAIKTQSLMMPKRFTPGYKVLEKVPDAGVVGTDRAYLGKFDGQGQSTKDAHFQQLSDQYLGYGQAARNFYKKHGLMSKGEQKWAQHLASGWEKAPVTMLAAQERVPPTVWQTIGAQDPHKAAQAVMKGSDDFGYKAPVEMLSQQRLGFIPLPDAGEIGTNKAFIGKADGSGQSTKARAMSLAQLAQLACGKGGLCPELTGYLNKGHLISPAEAAWAKTMPTENAAAKARTVKLSNFESDDFDTMAQGDDNFGMAVSTAGPNRQYPGVASENDEGPVTGMLKQLRSGKRASRTVAKDVTGYLFKNAHIAGL